MSPIWWPQKVMRSWKIMSGFFISPHLLNITYHVVPPNYIDARNCWETHGIYGEQDCFCYLWVIAFNTQLTKSGTSLHRPLEFYFSTGLSLPSDFFEFLILSWRALAKSIATFYPDATSDPAGKSALATYVWILWTTSALSIPLPHIALIIQQSPHILDSDIQHNSTDSLGILEENYNTEEENLDVSYTPASRFCSLISGLLWAMNLS